MHIFFFDACWIPYLLPPVRLYLYVLVVTFAIHTNYFDAMQPDSYQHCGLKKRRSKLLAHKCKQEHKRNRTNQPTIHPSTHPTTTTTTTTTPCKSESLAAKRCKYQSKPSNPKKRGKNPQKNCSPHSSTVQPASLCDPVWICLDLFVAARW